MSEFPYWIVRREQPQFTSSQVQIYIVIHLKLFNIDLFYTKTEILTFNYQRKDRQCKMRNKLNKYYYKQFYGSLLMYYFVLLIFTSIALFNENLFYRCNDYSKYTLILQVFVAVLFIRKAVDLVMLRNVITFLRYKNKKRLFLYFFR